MTVSFDDRTTNPAIIPSGTTATPFSNIVVNESDIPALELVDVVLSPGPNTAGSDLGSLSDPTGFGRYDSNSHIFVESAVGFSSPSAATAILRRLVYTPPALANGASAVVDATVSVGSSPLPPVPNGSTILADPKNPVVLQTVTAPGITGTIADQPVASGTALRPFASASIADNSPGYNAQNAGTITVTDGTAAPSDVGGALTGPGLTKTGVGTYALASAFSYAFQSNLKSLVFTSAALPGSGTRTTRFSLNVSDTATKLATSDTVASVQVVGPATAPVPPLVASLPADQTVLPGNAISPFNGVTVSDSNANPQVSATLTLSGGGTLSGAGLVAGSAGTYTVATTSPAALTATLGKLTFTAPALGDQPSAASTIKLDIADGAQIASNFKTTITAIPAPPGGAGASFTVTNQTTGQQVFVSGETYSGPVQGIDQQFILITPDNLNITAAVPNVFIRAGGGMNALDVSRANGNNVLDASIGSSFMTGGTGRDTFFLDDRNLASDTYSTVVNFHAGDNITIFGVNPADFRLTTQDNQGAVGAKGLAYTFSAPGKPNASVVIAGFSSADLANGRLTASYGSNPATPGVTGSGGSYFNIHGN